MNDMAISRKSNNQGLLDSIFAHIPDDTYIFWKDKNSVYLGCNSSYAKLLGLLSPEEIVGKTDLDFYQLSDGDSPELFQQGDHETLQGKYVKNQKEWLSVAGNKVLVLVSKAPLYADKEQKRLIGVLGVARDITERNRQDEELADTRYRLEGMTKVATSIAHELRTPLTSIQLGIGNLKKYFPTILEGYEAAVAAGLIKQKLKASTIDIIKNTLDAVLREVHLSTLAINLLLANVTPGKETKTSENFLIVHCVNEALERYPFKRGQRELIKWEPTLNFRVQGEETFIIHILFNLIKNALHYIAEARKGNILIWLEKGKIYNTLCFKDTGKGIAQEVLPNIFRQFYSKTYHGAGIGLTYCKDVMEKLGGQITCESEYNNYTLFKLSFPCFKDK